MSTIEPNSQPCSDTFYVVDFDRTLVDSDILLERFIAVVAKHTDVSTEGIVQAGQRAQQQGESFDAARYVRATLALQGHDEHWRELSDRFAEESSAGDMMLPGAARLLEALGGQKCRYGILTYGSPLWQGLKIRASGLHEVPRIITTHKEKGRTIAAWRLNGDEFALPPEFGGGVVQSIVLIDDKAVSFDGFPGAPSHGFHVVSSELGLPAQRGSVPGNVQRLTSLHEVVDRLGIDKT